jgi:3-deoxy-7-phosphoheptulonate synthase
MIVVMRSGATKEQIDQVLELVKEIGCQPHLSVGKERTIVGVIGEKRPMDEDAFRALDYVEKVVRILKPFKLASRDFHPENTVVPINGTRIGDNKVVVMAGPCAVENREQILETARAVKEAGVSILRAGAFKPRTSPYSFQGLGREGLDYLAEAKEETGLAIITEVMGVDQVAAISEVADILQVGARNMANYTLLHAVGESNKPVLLKRGMMSTMEEWLMAAEYILSHGNYRLMLCERGIRTFETYTRNTLDLSAVPLLKRTSHLPIIVDPSHATGNWELVEPLSMAAVAAGADGLLIEVHPHPEKALSDGPQSLRPERFADLVGKVRAIAQAVGRDI